MTVKWNAIWRKQSDSQITFLGGTLFADQQNCPRSVPLCHCVCLSLALSPALSVPLRYSVCANEWQSGDVVLIYRMVGQMEPGWNVSVIGASLKKKHLWCPGTTNCSIRNGFQPQPSVYLKHTAARTHARTHARARAAQQLTEIHEHTRPLLCLKSRCSCTLCCSVHMQVHS